MQDQALTTVFRFTCEFCAQPNEYREHHRPSIQPHLVATKCSHCHKLNWLGSLTGTIVDETVEADLPPVGKAEL